MIRKICYATGTRADFGLMQDTLIALQDAPELQLSIVVTGMHLSEKYGNTIDDIERAGLPIGAVVQVDPDHATGAAMARNLGYMLLGFVDAFEKISPDLVLVLGDRGEMLAAALAAIHLNIPVTHIHGGERSGTVDESIRHAISKLAHFHFVATTEARERLILMGERPDNVYITGAPGLDGIEALAIHERRKLIADAGLMMERPVALLVYHPVLQEADQAVESAQAILDALQENAVQTIALKPNSDAGSDGIRKLLEAHADVPDFRLYTHLPRASFVSWMAAADLMIGNSSSGIIEAASFGTPVINIGSRQNLRERNFNVIDVSPQVEDVSIAIRQAMAGGRFELRNLYGDGQAVGRIVSILRGLSLNPAILAKSNAY